MDFMTFIEKNMLFLIMNLSLVLSIFSLSIYGGLIFFVVLALFYILVFNVFGMQKETLADLNCLDSLSLKLDNFRAKLKKILLEQQQNKSMIAEKAKLAKQVSQVVSYDRESSTITTQQHYATPPKEFTLIKKGKILNFILFLIGAVPLIAVLFFLNNYLNLGMAISSSSLFILVPILLFNMIYYLPTLICYSPSKLFIFILNIFVSWTLIGWIILLFYANSSNRAYRYQEEMLHYQRNANKNHFYMTQ